MKFLLTGCLLLALVSPVFAQTYYDPYRHRSRQQMIMEIERLRQENLRLRQQGNIYAPHPYGGGYNNPANELNQFLNSLNQLKRNGEYLTR